MHGYSANAIIKKDRFEGTRNGVWFMKVFICIGSACHLRGSEAIVKTFQKRKEEVAKDLDIELCGSFCMGDCAAHKVSVKINDKIYRVTPEDAEEFFDNVIMKEAVK